MKVLLTGEKHEPIPFKTFFYLSFFVCIPVLFYSCGINKEDITELAKEKKFDELNRVIDEQLTLADSKDDKQAALEAKELLLTALQQGILNGDPSARDKTEELFWDNGELSLDALKILNNTQSPLKDDAQFYSEYYSDDKPSSEVTAEYEKQLPLIGTEKHTTYLKKRLKDNFSDSDWEETRLTYNRLIQVSKDTTGKFNIIAALKETEMYADAVKQDNYETVSPDITELESQQRSLEAQQSDLENSLTGLEHDLDDALTAADDATARVYEFEQETFYVQAYIAGSAGDNEYEIVFSNGRGILIPPPGYSYTTTGLVHVMTYPRGYKTVTLKSGGYDEWRIYKAVPGYKLEAYYDDKASIAGLTQSYNNAKYALNSAKSQITSLQSRIDAFDAPIEAKKDAVKMKYSDIKAQLKEKLNTVW